LILVSKNSLGLCPGNSLGLGLCLKGGGIFKDHFIANVLEVNVLVKECRKSVHIKHFTNL